MTKSFGVLTGVNYNKISYNYPLINSVGRDELVYFSFPLGIRLRPTKKVSFAIGGLYNNFYKGQLTIKYENFERSEPYATGIFENSIGGFTQIKYNFFKNLNTYLNFRWATKNNSPTMPQSNNTQVSKLEFHTKFGFKLDAKYLLKTFLINLLTSKCQYISL